MDTKQVQKYYSKQDEEKESSSLNAPNEQEQYSSAQNARSKNARSQNASAQNAHEHNVQLKNSQVQGTSANGEHSQSSTSVSQEFCESKVPFAITDESYRIGLEHEILINSNLSSENLIQIIPASERELALKTVISQMQNIGRRTDFTFRGEHFHLARASCDMGAQAVLELYSNASLPSCVRRFNKPVVIIKSSRTDLFTPIQRTYIMSHCKKGEVPLQCANISKKERKRAVTIIGKLLFDIAHLHSMGILAGDLSISNIGVRKEDEPTLRSPAHLRSMSKMGEGVAEALLLICDFVYQGYIHLKQVPSLINHYLASEKTAYLHAKYFLHREKKKLPETVQKMPVENQLMEVFKLYYAKFYC
ncbi:MAG: hypothetical protein WC492_04260 [Candidatus Micrarchaeia archaeon]